VFHYRQQKVT